MLTAWRGRLFFDRLYLAETETGFVSSFQNVHASTADVIWTARRTQRCYVTTNNSWQNALHACKQCSIAAETAREYIARSTAWSTAFRAMLLRAALWWMTAIYWPNFATFTYPSPVWRRQSPRSIGFIFGMRKENQTGWATIWWRSHDDRLSLLGTIHQRDRHTDSHVAMANAAP